MTNDKEYYVYVIDSNKISLVENAYEVTKPKPDFVKVAITTAGVLSPVNPSIELFRGSTVNFDLSDSSLSYIQNTSSLPAFDFKLYNDNKFTKEFETTGLTNVFEVTSTGTVGVTADAKVTLKVNSDTPKLLYYKLNPIETNENLLENKQIVVDDEVDLNNQLIIKDSKYSGTFKITSTGSTTFTYDIVSTPESSSFTSVDSTLKYSTISTTAYGGVKEVTVIDNGGGYLEVPGITTVTSNVGSGVVLESFSNNIGKVTKTTLENIGFDYPSDVTLQPEVLFPQILRITPLTGFKSIGITSLGKGYIQNPSLVVLDGVTKKEITDVDLRYRPDELFVEILKNSETMNAATPTIVPIGNPNGIRVSNLVYDNDGQHVTATIKNAFSGVVGFSGTYVDPFPFVVGDKVLVENASVGDVIWFDSPDYDDVKFDRIVKTSVSTNDFIMQKYVASSSEWSVTLRFEVRAGGDNDGVTSDFNGKLVYSQDKTFYKGGMDDRARRWDLGDITWDYRVYGKPVWMIRIVAHSNNAGLPLTFTFDNDCYADISFQQLDGGQYDIDLFEPANYTPQYCVIEARPDTLEFKLELLDIKEYDHPERYNDKEVRTSWYNVSYTGPASIDPFTLGYNTSGYHKVTDISDTNAPIRLFNLDSSKKHVFRITVDGNTYFCPQGVDGGRHIDVSDKIGRYNDRYCLVKAGSTGGAWGTFGYGYDDSQGFDYYRIGLENQAHWWELQYAEGSGDADDPDNYSLQNAIRRARNAWSRTNVGSHYVDAHMKISCNNYSPFLRYYGGMQWHFRSGGGINYVDIIYDPLDQKGDANRVKWYTYKDSPLPLVTVFEKEYGVGPSEVKFGDAVRENSNIDVTKAQITRGTVYKFARYEHTDGTAIDASGFNRVLQGGAILITDLRQTSVERTDGEDNTYHIGTNYGRFVDADTWVATTPW